MRLRRDIEIRVYLFAQIDPSFSGVHCGMKSCSAARTNSYGPRWTIGRSGWKSWRGGGEVVDHSRVVACQGFGSAMRPLRRLANKFHKKTSCPAIRKTAA